MYKYIFMVIALLFLPTSINATEIPIYYEPEGLWLTENERSVVKVERCKDSRDICGYIYWIIDGGMTHDTKNPVEELRGQPMCDLQVLQNFQASQLRQNEWVDGKIYKADDGDIYNATLNVMSGDKMEVRGYIGIPLLGKSQTWTRVNAKNYPKCKVIE